MDDANVPVSVFSLLVPIRSLKLSPISLCSLFRTLASSTSITRRTLRRASSFFLAATLTTLLERRSLELGKSCASCVNIALLHVHIAAPTLTHGTLGPCLKSPPFSAPMMTRRF